ncbi:MAG TPA: hypothetical protein DCP28_18890 [Cytophagales bacterium]|nr:hypothetical protein [Cytophagales bacterium]
MTFFLVILSTAKDLGWEPSASAVRATHLPEVPGKPLTEFPPIVGMTFFLVILSTAKDLGWEQSASAVWATHLPEVPGKPLWPSSLLLSG